MVNAKGAIMVPHAYLSKQWKVESRSKKGVYYIVRTTPKGLRCSCPQFIFRGKCKHLTTIDMYDIVPIYETDKTQQKPTE